MEHSLLPAVQLGPLGCGIPNISLVTKGFAMGDGKEDGDQGKDWFGLVVSIGSSKAQAGQISSRRWGSSPRDIIRLQVNHKGKTQVLCHGLGDKD